MENSNNNADLTVIGGGPSGYAAAMRALDFNQHVVLIERHRLGGAGIHDGALSSKTFWERSVEFDAALNSAIRTGRAMPEINFSEVKNEVMAAVTHRETQLKNHLDALIAHEQSGRIEFQKGEASLLNPETIRIQNGESTQIVSRNTILATGSRPRRLPEITTDEKIIFSSDGIGQLDHFPKSLVILGAGVIGCEFAAIFANFRQTKVFLIDKAERILPFEDEDLAQVVQNNLEQKGVTIHRGSRLLRMEIKNDAVEYELEFNDGRREIHHVEKALISVGRVPNVENIGLENARIKLDNRGHIATTESRTTCENIFAVGDLTADIALVNVGELEGRHAVEMIYGKPKPLCHDNISTIMFLCPEVAGVGMNEQQARNNEIPYRVATVDYKTITRAIAMRQTEGFFKILIREDDQRILGMRAIGAHASSAIQAVSLLISMGKTCEELAELIHPHPSIIEGIQECARLFSGKSIFKPYALPNQMQVRGWRPS
jgi:dihydrolipoamide dehydrogenase